ncbi:hypothetical protein JYP52_21255 [Nitratireductor aquibiodomus]|uniref:hypothetical protein n=1 Tax=Nitratireductor TaxID=245876 RepID=UPI000DDDD68B|nr:MULTISPECIES: hypothetical protein [Nitratireductor]MBN7763669.1 hypothetical protein [Nitratireductor aquibiodomus]
MKTDRLVKLLKMLNAKVPIAQQRAGWFVSSCPLAPWTHDGGTDKNPAFAVKKEGGDAFCNCFACGFHGKLSALVLEVRHRNATQQELTVNWGDALTIIEDAEAEDYLNLDSPTIEDMLFGEKATLHEFPDWWIESFPPVESVPFARDYLAERGVSLEVAKALDLRTDTKQQRVCFPVRDFYGRLVGLHGRAIKPEVDPRYRMYLQAGRNNPIVWLGESWVNLDKPIVVVEGPMDLASVYRVYRNVVSPLFVNPSMDKLMRMADALEWVTLYDRGKGGDIGREKVSRTLRKDHVLVHLTPPEGAKDPGECTVDQLVDLLSPHLLLDPFVGVEKS